MSAPSGRREATVVSLRDLHESKVPFETLEGAFGPASLGIILVKDLPPEYIDLRSRVLSYASILPTLPREELDSIEDPASRYHSGWSHGKEALKAGQFDTMKGSYYINCAFYQGRDLGKDRHVDADRFPEMTSPNKWPSESSMPGFRQDIERLCTLIIDTAALVARACDEYAGAHIESYEPGYLERVVRASLITKARLLHYFPSSHQSFEPADLPSKPPAQKDSWCSTHIDSGCLTGLTSAMYIDEMTVSPHIGHEVPLPSLAEAPSSETGLFIHARDSSIVKVSIPMDCLAFQTGEALQLITNGKFRAVPHFVCAGAGSAGTKVARNTLAVFTQPNLEAIVDKKRDLSFGEFSKEVAGRFANDEP